MNPKRRPEYLYIALITAGIGIVSVIVMCIALMSGGNSLLSGKDSEGRQMIQRAQMITGSEESCVEERLSAGMYSMSDYLISVFESPNYLAMCDSDEVFARDLAKVVYGEYDDDDVDVIMRLLASDSRQNTISNILKDVKGSYKATMKVPKAAGRDIGEVMITEDFTHDGRVLMGINTATGTIGYDGSDIRADIFIDGAVCHGFLAYDGTDQNGNKIFKISWDTSQARPGDHELKLIIRTSEGRSKAFDAGSIDIPDFEEMMNDRVYEGTLPGSSDAVWYRINCEERDCYVNFVGLSGDIKVSLYDLYGNSLGTNDLEGLNSEVLRGRAQDVAKACDTTGIKGISNCFYVRVQHGMTDARSEDIGYMMVTSPEVAYYNGTYMAVTQQGETVRLVDKDVQLYEDEISKVKMLPINAALCDVDITDRDSNEAISLWPSFETQNKEYAYYMSSAASVRVAYKAQEGYAAQVAVTLNGAKGSDDDGGAILSLKNGMNSIGLKVTAFSGEVSEYKIYILCGDDDTGFASTLEEFPQSYYSGLILLHAQHPEYVFTAYDTGLDFEEVVSVQDSGGRSLATYTYNPTYVKPDSRIYDAPDWMAVKPEVIRYYLDPRNFLRIECVFMFERQSFNPDYHTREGIAAMIAGTFMDTDDYDYVSAIYNAAETSGVSPYLLASRILQEMGNYGQSNLATGTVQGYEGYYNYYNIGAYASTSEGGPVLNGAKYAKWGSDPEAQEITEREAECLLPWDSIDKAITGGAIWIASGYINNGQDTLYFQKFDVVDNGTDRFNHQYAGNIMMAYSEGYRYYKSYMNTQQLDRSFEFIIPVYDNMPEEYGFLP